MSTTHHPDAEAIIEAAQAAAHPAVIDLDRTKVHAITVPQNGRVEIIDIDDEDRQPTPNRTRGEYRLATQESFIEYVKSANDLEDSQHLTVWVDEPSTKITAVFNDATAAAPAWRDHRAILDLVLTEEWKHWIGKNGRLLEQEVFAEHIEDGLAEIATPDSATMLEIAQTFQATSSEDVTQVRRLHSGEVTAKWSQEVTASAGIDGSLEIPKELQLVIPVFVGDREGYAITARIRYRLREGNLTIGYKLDHPERVIHFAMESIQGRLTTEFPGSVYLGTAPASARGR